MGRHILRLEIASPGAKRAVPSGIDHGQSAIDGTLSEIDVTFFLIFVALSGIDAGQSVTGVTWSGNDAVKVATMPFPAPRTALGVTGATLSLLYLAE